MSQLLASPPQVRPSRRPGALLTRAAAPFAALALVLLAPRTAAAQSPTYEACLQAVGDLADRCLAMSDNVVGDLACMWAGGLGILACALLEAIRQLIPSTGYDF